MLVYGDPQYQQPLSLALRSFMAHAQQCRANDLDSLRSLLIHAGQLEQAASDSWLRPSGRQIQILHAIEECTDRAARLFCQSWDPGIANWPSGEHTNGVTAGIVEPLRHFCLPADPLVTLKIPEGFEFYALFPEQYAVTAWKWAKDHAGLSPRRVLIVGIRSIGTSLSAVVKAVLQARGWMAERITVRPAGHPFSRKLELEAGAVSEATAARGADGNGGARLPPSAGTLLGASCAIIVDEGPGLSGSSMASVASALASAGIRQISFFPGHLGMPGCAASPEVQNWWGETPRYFTALEELRWGGLGLRASLARKTEELLQNLTERSGRRADTGDSGVSVAIQDLSGGLWRRSAFRSEAEWPAITPVFERMKFLCGGRQPVLWKFSGLGCAVEDGSTQEDLSLARMRQLAKGKWGPPPLGRFRGFLAVPWVKGRRLTYADARHPALLAHLARYLAESAGPPLTPAQSQTGLLRLADMLCCNTQESLGPEAAERARALVEALLRHEPESEPSFADGRMGPWEWIRTSDGRFFKTDNTGHQLDHTLIGRQSILWDVAGTTVEWDLDASRTATLLRSIRQRGLGIQRKRLEFHRLAYAAFRLGMMQLASGHNGATNEQQRLQRAVDFYAAQLDRRIGILAGCGTVPQSSTVFRPGR